MLPVVSINNKLAAAVNQPNPAGFRFAQCVIRSTTECFRARTRSPASAAYLQRTPGSRHSGRPDCGPWLSRRRLPDHARPSGESRANPAAGVAHRADTPGSRWGFPCRASTRTATHTARLQAVLIAGRADVSADAAGLFRRADAAASPPIWLHSPTVRRVHYLWFHVAASSAPRHDRGWDHTPDRRFQTRPAPGRREW